MGKGGVRKCLGCGAYIFFGSQNHCAVCLQEGVFIRLGDDLMIASGVFEGYVVPYKRQTQRQRHKGYAKSKRVLGDHMRLAFVRDGKLPPFPLIRQPFTLSLVIHVPLTKAGQIPKNAGDADNVLKAFADSAKTSGVIEDDSMYHMRGLKVRINAAQDSQWKYKWAFYALEESPP